MAVFGMWNRKDRHTPNQQEGQPNLRSQRTGRPR